MLLGIGQVGHYLEDDEIGELVAEALSQVDLEGKRILIIIPDSTRTAPIPLFFRLFFFF